VQRASGIPCSLQFEGHETQTSGVSRRENVDVYLLFEIRIEISAALHSSQRRDVGNAGHSASTIASSPSVSAAGPGCRISGGRTVLTGNADDPVLLAEQIRRLHGFFGEADDPAGRELAHG
jgi:hypothetical protein